MRPAPQIKGWCPSAWRPMLTGDGYLVRLRFSCGILSSEEGRAIATLAQRYGNGLIDLTRRANLQIRGVAEDGIDELQRELLARDLIARDTQGVDAPNVVACPLAGRDGAALLDIRPLVRELEQRLASDHAVRGLPAKFCVAVEDGGRFSLRDVDADIAFEACRDDGFVVRIGGKERVGFVEGAEIAETALALVTAFVTLRNRKSGPARRMRDLIDEVGLSTIIASCAVLGRASATSWSTQDEVDSPASSRDDGVGLSADDVCGVAAPFGSLKADRLALVADLADRYAESELRLTPWRAVLIPAIAPGTIEHIKSECARAGLITEPSDPRHHAAACTGAPGCTSTSVATRDVAASLASLLPPHETLHVSGCAKSCASSIAASVTLVGCDGRFDLVRNGKARDTPVLFGLSAEDARAAVARIAAEELAHV